MKKLYALLLPALLWLAAGVLQAQDYRPFSMGQTPYFINATKDTLQALRFDSAYAAGPDSVFRFNKIALPVKNYSSPGCSASGATHLLSPDNRFGSLMFKKANGDLLFITAAADTFLLKTQVPLNQSWTFHAGLNISASISRKTSGAVVSVTDSVLTISLSNGDSIRISKNYGLVESPDFMSMVNPLFPKLELELYALPERGLGEAIASVNYFYDFQPGDVFRFKSTQTSMNGMLCSQVWEQRKILNRYTSAAGEVMYEVEVEKAGETFGSPNAPSGWCQGSSGRYHVPPATSFVKITPASAPLADMLPSQFRVSGSSYFVSDGLVRGGYNGRWQSNIVTRQLDNCSQTFGYTIDSGQGTQLGEGLGTVLGSDFMIAESKTVLECYTKSSETYGNCVAFSVLVGTKEEQQQQQFAVFPNPFQAELRVQLPEPADGPVQVEVLNSLGQVVKRFATVSQAATLQLDLPELPKGIYLLRVRAGQEVQLLKVLKQ